MLLKLIKLPEESSSCLWKRKDHTFKRCHAKKWPILFDLFTRNEVKRKVETFCSKRCESLQGQEDAHGATDNLNERRSGGFEVNTNSFLATSAYLSIARHTGVSKPTAHPSFTFLHFIIDRKCTYNMSSWNSSWHESERKNRKRSARRKCKIM